MPCSDRFAHTHPVLLTAPDSVPWCGTGVCSNEAQCTGTLLPTARHVLTAAHCLMGTQQLSDTSAPYYTITNLYFYPGTQSAITETNSLHFVLVGMQNRTFASYLVTLHGILTPVMRISSALPFHGMGSCVWPPNRVPISSIASAK
jgi:Trypsin